MAAALQFLVAAALTVMMVLPLPLIVTCPFLLTVATFVLLEEYVSLPSPLVRFTSSLKEFVAPVFLTVFEPVRVCPDLVTVYFRKTLPV